MPDLQLADEASRLVAYLRSADLSLITAESCTAGQISAELSAVAGSGKVMEGGFVVYSPAAKLALPGLDPNWLERFNADQRGGRRGHGQGGPATQSGERRAGGHGVARQ